MEKTASFQADLARCKELMLSHQFAEALVLGKQLFEYDSDNMALHLLLATLYARNNQLMEALSHYMLLAQFDPEFKEPHCKEMARGYQQKGLTDAGAVLAHAGAVKLESKELYQLAVDLYTQSGNIETAERLKQEL